MINVSEAWREAMQTGTRYYPTASLTLASGTVLSLAKGDFMIDNNGYTDGAGANALPVGAAICRTIRLELANADGRFTGTDFQDAVCRLSLNVDLASGTEAVAVGVFTLGKPETFGETVIINGQDDMHKADRPYTTALTYPATALAVLQEACSACGITFTATSIPEGTFSIPEAPSTQLTFRSVIGYVAGLSGACARINRLGVLEVVSFAWSALAAQRAAQTANGIHDLTRYTEIQMELQDVTVTGVKAEIYDDATGGTSELLVGAEGYTLTIDNPLIAGQEATALATIGAALIGAQFRILRLDHVAYPLAEFGDGCRITDKAGAYVYTVITDVDFTFHGFTVLTNSGEAPERAMATYTAPDTSALVKAAALVKSEKTAREAAVEALAQQLAGAGGMYETTEAAAGGGTIYYLHDKPTLASSLVVLKLTAEALGISTDGGQTYPAGWDFVTGTTITNTLQAVGINADWINTGALTVTDADGNVLFKADATAKTVQIGPFYVFPSNLYYSDNYTTTGSKTEIYIGSANGLKARRTDASPGDGTWATVNNGAVYFGPTVGREDKPEFVIHGGSSSTDSVQFALWSGSTFDTILRLYPPDAPTLHDARVDISEGLWIEDNLQVGGLVKTNGFNAMGLIKILGAEDHLDDVSTRAQGIYFQPYNANAKTALGYPVNYAGYLEVINADGNANLAMQRYTAYRRSYTSVQPEVFTRFYYYVTGWTAWTPKPDTQFTLTSMTNSYVSATDFTRMQAYRRNNINILEGNLQLANSLPSNATFFTIGTITSWSALTDVSVVAPAQNGSGAILVSISAAGVVQIWNGSGTQATGFHRFSLTVPSSSS